MTPGNPQPPATPAFSLARLVELDPKYVDTIVARWQRFTGERARHAGSGTLFPQSAEEADTTYGEVGSEGATDGDHADAA